jgi:hypothetical protein
MPPKKVAAAKSPATDADGETVRSMCTPSYEKSFYLTVLTEVLLDPRERAPRMLRCKTTQYRIFSY